MILVLEGARGLLASLDGLIDHHETSVGKTPPFLARKTRDALRYRRRFVQSTTERGLTFEKRINNMISLVRPVDYIFPDLGCFKHMIKVSNPP